MSGAVPTIDGRCALVTGSGAGLGYAIACGLASAGASVVIHGLEPEEDVATRLRELAGRSASRVAYVRSDLSSEAGARTLVEAARAAIGDIDILVNNAVARHFSRIDEFPVAAWENALAVNISAPFHLVRLVLPAMRRKGWGRIVNMTSVYGERGTPNRIDYVTTKSALLGFTRAVAMETLADGITCNAVSPGSVLTPGTEDRVERIRQSEGVDRHVAERKFLHGKQPSGRFVQAGDVAAAIAFLCSPAARDITGAVLPIDGGWLAS